MPQCPNCRAENQPGSRFCAECGTRLDQLPAEPQDQPTAPARSTGGPAQPTGKETIVLRIPDLAPADRPPAPPPADKTVVAGTAPAVSPATGATIVSGLPPVSTTPGRPAAPPTSALSASQSDGGRIWLVIALIALLGLALVAALVGGIMLIARGGEAPAHEPTPEIGGGLARFPTAAPRPTSTERPTATTRPTAAPKPTAAPSAFSTVLLEDDFDNPQSSSLTEEKNDTATYAFLDGVYAITVKAPKYIVWSNFKGSYSDIAVEVDATLDSGPPESAAGLLFRYQDADNFYFYRVSADGNYNLTLYKQGQRQVLIDWTESPAIKGLGQTNRLRVEAEGDRIRLFVNDTLLDEVSDDAFGKGELALAANTFDKGDAAFSFDNLIVRGRK